MSEIHPSQIEIIGPDWKLRGERDPIFLSSHTESTAPGVKLQ